MWAKQVLRYAWCRAVFQSFSLRLKSDQSLAFIYSYHISAAARIEELWSHMNVPHCVALVSSNEIRRSTSFFSLENVILWALGPSRSSIYRVAVSTATANGSRLLKN